MKRAFFFFVIVFLVIATAAYILYLIGDALHSMYRDWQLGKELDELEAELRERRNGSENKPS